MKRRTLLMTPGAALAAMMPLAPQKTRSWIGPEYFANRYQDWRLHEGRIECLTAEAGDECRTVALLDREVRGVPFTVSVKLGLLADAGGGGFAGLLVGAGAGQLDWRAAALNGRGSGEGGGILCVYETTGRAAFRDHTSETDPVAYADIPKQSNNKAPFLSEGELKLTATSAGADHCHLKLEMSGAAGRSEAEVRDVPLALLRGGVHLVSSTMPGKRGARFWFRDIRFSGSGITTHPERTFGPILGTMFSQNQRVLKLTAQMAPLGEADPQTVILETRTKGRWEKRAEAKIDLGWVARFRVTGWDSSHPAEYRVRYGSALYEGRIPADPGTSRPLRVGFVSCVMPVWRTMDSGVFQPGLPGEQALGRYTTKNFYFPHTPLITNLSAHKPDLLAFLGDQIYENVPTRKITDPSPTLDYLYKWSFFVWAFRDLTRNTPTIVMVDDHDVYHGNVWGHGGRKAPEDVQEAGGYIRTPEFVNLVQRTQCSHNPDAYDPRPIDQGIEVYYGSFDLGGVRFAFLEDRKFKTGPKSPDPVEPQLLGERQESFLREFAKLPPGPRICFSQTVYGCAHTMADRSPSRDTDSNGWPKAKRDVAVKLLKDARMLGLCGDQHLAHIVRHAEGVIQFSGPGGGTSFQRWFEAPMGKFTDAFGNNFEVLAVANPKVSFEVFQKHRPMGRGLGDRNLKSEGYGIVVVDHAARTYTLECWPFDADPRKPGAKQFAGWPMTVSFDEV